MKITPIVANRFKSDGGSMFGLVPKGIWSKMLEPDADNLIKQHAHVLLLELDDGRIGLVDTGCGPESKFSEKAAKRHGLSTNWPLEERLLKLGITRDMIDFVVLTHLHWDHAGGASCGTPDDLFPSFPNAVHCVHEKEWKDATGGDPLLYKSYPSDTIEPLKTLPADKLKLATKDREEVLPGVHLVRSGGHTRGHCTVQLTHETGIELDHPEAMFMFTPRNIIFAGDVCPMQHNLRMVFQTAYDTYPLETRKWKTKWLSQIAEEQILLMFDHDPDLFGGIIRTDAQKEFRIDRGLHTAMSPQYALPSHEVDEEAEAAPENA